MEKLLLIKCPNCNKQISEFKDNSYICEKCGLVEPISLSPQEMLIVLPYDILQQIVFAIHEKNIFEMLKLRKVNKKLKEIVDRRINTIYEEKYKVVPEVIDVNVILDILREYLPYRKGKSEFQYGDFGNPNDSLNDRYNKIFEYYMNDEDLKKFRTHILREILYEENDKLKEIFLKKFDGKKFDGENFDIFFDGLEEHHIKELNVEKESNTGEYLYIVLKEIRYGRPEELYEIYPQIVNALFEFFPTYLDIFANFQINYINKIVQDNNNYQIGDYFYYYKHENGQSPGIGMVDYDVMNGVKIPVFDDEGMESLTPEIQKQITQLGTVIGYPTEEEIRKFLDGFRR